MFSTTRSMSFMGPIGGNMQNTHLILGIMCIFHKKKSARYENYNALTEQRSLGCEKRTKKTVIEDFVVLFALRACSSTHTYPRLLGTLNLLLELTALLFLVRETNVVLELLLSRTTAQKKQ